MKRTPRSSGTAISKPQSMPERTRKPRSAYADNTRTERNRQLRAAKKAAGLVKVEAWVPADRVDGLREMAAKMREEG